MLSDNEKILVTRSSMPDFDEYVEEIRPLWESAWLTNMGVLHEKLHDELIDYLQVPGLTMFSNGHMALEMALDAMKLSGEVITTPFSFSSTTHAITRNGLTPVFCDINPDNYTIDADKIEELITEKTTAIVPVHVYGNICDVEKIDKIAKKHGLKVIYDAAHAFGVKYKGRGIGNYGDASMFSFHATKVFNTIEGGAVSYNDKDFEKVLRYLKNFGITDKENVDYIGGNAKMNEFQAAMGICNLRHIEREIGKRRKVVERYIERLDGVCGLIIQKPQEGVESNYAYFPLVVDNYKISRNGLYDLLAENNIFARKYFYPLITDYNCYRESFKDVKLPVAKRISDNVLTLPCYADLSLDTVDRICDIILGVK